MGPFLLRKSIRTVMLQALSGFPGSKPRRGCLQLLDYVFSSQLVPFEGGHEPVVSSASDTSSMNEGPYAPESFAIRVISWRGHFNFCTFRKSISGLSYLLCNREKYRKVQHVCQIIFIIHFVDNNRCNIRHPLIGWFYMYVRVFGDKPRVFICC